MAKMRLIKRNDLDRGIGGVIAYYADERGNTWPAGYCNTRNEAAALSDTLKDCYGCFNCAHCVGCVGCSKCHKCSDCFMCIDCSECENANRCVNCCNCTVCISCGYCVNLQNKTGAYSVDGSSYNEPWGDINVTHKSFPILIKAADVVIQETHERTLSVVYTNHGAVMKATSQFKELYRALQSAILRPGFELIKRVEREK